MPKTSSRPGNCRPEESSALTFTRIVAQWQNTMRPLCRLTLIGLFLASGGCFLWFVFLQLKILLPNLL
jgi:hypothetical protein